MEAIRAGHPAEEAAAAANLVARRIGQDAVLPTGKVAARCRREPADGIAGEWILPPGTESSSVLLFLHGGGFTGGTARTYVDLAARLGVASGRKVFSLEYRLAPEHPCPAAVDDVVAAVEWLIAQGTTAERIALAGNSAGGALAIAAAVALRDAGRPVPGAIVALSPWTDLTLSAPSVGVDTDLCSRAILALQAAAYLAGRDPRDPRASVRFADLRALPPMLVQVGGAEMLLDDGVGVAEAARAVDVDTTLEVWPDMPHSWHVLTMLEPRAAQAIERAGAWLRERP